METKINHHGDLCWWLQLRRHQSSHPDRLPTTVTYHYQAYTNNIPLLDSSWCSSYHQQRTKSTLLWSMNPNNWNSAKSVDSRPSSSCVWRRHLQVNKAPMNEERAENNLVKLFINAFYEKCFFSELWSFNILTVDLFIVLVWPICGKQMLMTLIQAPSLNYDNRADNVCLNVQTRVLKHFVITFLVNFQFTDHKPSTWLILLNDDDVSCWR